MRDFQLRVALGLFSCAMSSEFQTASVPAGPPRAAAILDEGDGAVDMLLAEIACELRRSGRTVRGLVTKPPEDGGGCHSARILLDIETWDEHLISQNLGGGSIACNADPQGFAQASRVLRDALHPTTDLVICNRFGGMEANGGGFAAELLALMAEGKPVLTLVARRYLEAWARFTGGAPVLTSDRDAWMGWIEQVVPRLPGLHAPLLSVVDAAA